MDVEARRTVAAVLVGLAVVAGAVGTVRDRSSAPRPASALNAEDCPKSECGGSGNHNQVLL
jgi:hypothetical protein